ncbi:hypothetical protein [Ilumatobacter sp.]|uniref:hypothetical protein n=1 Tax=Ilumatobacter sp. TaxID=1967498 RepID=UPI003AF51EE8
MRTPRATGPTMIKQNIDAALGPDGRSAIIAVRELRRRDLPWMEERAVRLARAEGYSWAQLGRLLRRSRQAVRQRYGHVDGTVQLLPPLSPTTEQFVVNLVGTRRDDVRRRREFDRARSGDLIAW